MLSHQRRRDEDHDSGKTVSRSIWAVDGVDVFFLLPSLMKMFLISIAVSLVALLLISLRALDGKWLSLVGFRVKSEYK